MKQKTNWTLAGCFVIFLGGATLAEDAATGVIRSLSSVKFSVDNDEMADHQATRLGPGGFAVMRGRMPHQFTCQSQVACLMIVAFDRPYDIYWGKSG